MKKGIILTATLFFLLVLLFTISSFVLAIKPTDKPGATPAIPATPAQPNPGTGIPATPALPATPAIPSSKMSYDYETVNTFNFDGVYSAAYNKNNNHLYLWSLDSVLVETDTSGNIIGELEADATSGGLAYNPNKDILYNVNFNDGTITEKDISTGQTIRILNPGISANPGGITYDYDEDIIYVVNPNSDRIYKIDSDGNLITSFYVHDILPAMVGIAYNEHDGNLLILDFHKGYIMVMRKDGTPIESFSYLPFGPGWNARDIAFNPHNKHMYITDFILNSVTEIAPK